jgi:flagellar protein FlbD
MIVLTKLGGTPFALNADLIETIVENPDTTIYLTLKKYYIVQESMQEVIDKVIAFRKEINGVEEQ